MPRHKYWLAWYFHFFGWNNKLAFCFKSGIFNLNRWPNWVLNTGEWPTARKMPKYQLGKSWPSQPGTARTFFLLVTPVPWTNTLFPEWCLHVKEINGFIDISTGSNGFTWQLISWPSLCLHQKKKKTTQIIFSNQRALRIVTFHFLGIIHLVFTISCLWYKK